MLEKLPDFVGHALRDTRAGLDHVVARKLDLGAGADTITLQAADFTDHGAMPLRHTADGDGTSPALHWSNVPDGASALVLVVEDADSPTPQPLVHAIVVGLPGAEGGLEEGAMNDELSLPPPGRLGRNSFLKAGWLPPDPPPGHGQHRYVFQLFALGAHDAGELDGAPGRDAVVAVLEKCAVASGTLVGVYERPDGSIRVEDGEPPPLAAA